MTDQSTEDGGIINLRGSAMSDRRDAFIAQLHDEAPLYKDDDGFWVASNYEDVRAILLDHARFSSSAMGGAGGAMGPAFPLLMDDPPRHTTLRRLLAKAFTPAAIDAMKPAIASLAHDLAAKISPGQEIDIVSEMATPLPVAVIAQMMGVPRDRASDFKRWSDAMIGLQESPFESDRIKTLVELREYFGKISAERREGTGDDLISALTRSRETTETLNDDQIVDFCTLLLIAGNETTTNLLGNLLNRLANAPRDWAALRGNQDLIDAAIEESLRLDSPVQFVMRLTRTEVALGGHTIPEGELVMVYLGAANRDPSKWGDPAIFESAREKERHLGFGHGVHICIGALLARIEARAVIAALVQRFETLSHGKRPGKRLPHGMLFGFRTLPVVFG